MIPLRITAVLAEPVVTYLDGLHLDGPLSYGAFRLLPVEEREALPPIDGPVATDMDIPLKRWTCPAIENTDPNILDAEGMLWGWCASAAHADWQLETSVQIRKRPAISEMVHRTSSPSVQISAGPFKAQDKRYPAMFAWEVHWFAVGCLAPVERLLAEVPAIGKLTHHGHGRILRWRVEPWHEDWSVERGDGLTRRMPVGWHSGEGWPGRGAIRAPYHHRSRVVPCREPDYRELHP